MWALAGRYAGGAKPGNELLDEYIVVAEEEFLAGKLFARFPIGITAYGRAGSARLRRSSLSRQTGRIPSEARRNEGSG
jgi:hypothetical protein